MIELPKNDPSFENETMKTARENFSTWNRALESGDAKQVALLYSEDATFLPTVSGKFKIGQADAEEYFQHFLEKNPTGEIIDDKVQILGTDSYLHSGMYNFKVGPDSNRQTVEARFSFVWNKNDQGKWKIIHHHSSTKPKE